MRIELRSSERLVLRKQPDIPNSEWSERNIYLKKSSMPGPFRNKVQPYLAGIMDLFGLPWVRELDLCKGVQTGGTTAAYNCLSRESATSSDMALLAMADEKTVKGRMKNFVIPMYQDSETLRDFLSDNPDDTGIYGINLKNGFNIKAGWGTSVASLASDPCRVVVLDEIDKYSSRENIEEAKDRASTYPDTSKIFALSTPGEEDGPICEEIRTCDVVYDFHVECPDCGVRQIMVWEFFRWPKQLALVGEGGSLDYRHIRRLKLATYQCPHCDKHWDDNKRNLAVAKGAEHSGDGAVKGWIPREKVDRPAKIGLVLPSWLSRFVSLSAVVAEYLEAEESEKSGDSAKMNHWQNNRAAEPVKKVKQERKETQILALRDDRPEGLVPSVPIAAITCVADMQKRGFWYKITAWGYGLEQESWNLKAGFVDSWEALRLVMFESQFKDVNGNAYVVTLRGMDSGGGEGEHQDLSRTAEAYLFAAANPGVVLFKGRQRMSRQYNVTDLDRIPGTNKPLPGSAKLYTVHSTFFKDKLAGKLRVNTTDPGAWHLHAETDEDFARQMCSESKNDQGLYECPKGKDNHLWDCSYMELALVEIAQVKIWQEPEITAQSPGGRRIRGQAISA